MAKDILKLSAEIVKFIGLCSAAVGLIWFIIAAAGTF